MADTYIIASPLSIFLEGIAVLVLIYCGTKYYLNASKHEKSTENLMMYGFAFLFFFFSLNSSLLLISEFQLDLIYENGLFYGNHENPTELFYIFDTIGRIIGIIGYVSIIVPFERIVKKTKYCLSLMNVIFIVIGFLLLSIDYEIIHTTLMIFFFIDIIIFAIIMILLSKWSKREFKAISIIILFGIILIIVGSDLRDPDIKSLDLLPVFITPLLFIVGGLICVSPLVLNPKSFSNALSYWLILGFIALFILIGMTIFSLLFLPVVWTIMFLFASILGGFLSYYMIKDVKSQKSLDLFMAETELKTLPVQVLEKFIRPKKITEEEVSISKEKKICLICKGRVGGIMFMCSECGSFYCKNCSEALSDMENACWVCNAPFDESKPVKPYEKEEEEEEILVSEKAPGKPKIDDHPPKK